eukprot:15367007-Ditylum_brightwellii.AAC.3
MDNDLAADDNGALVGVADADSLGFAKSVTVSGSPIESINGIYHLIGFEDYVFKYAKDGPLNNKFIIRRRPVLDSRRWIISFRGVGFNLATGKEHLVNLYSALHLPGGLNYNPHIPPSTGWLPNTSLGGDPAAHGNLRVEPSFLDLVDNPPDVDHLQITTYTTGQDICPVCTERFLFEEFLVELQCGHTIHRGCLDHLRMKRQFKCPICRHLMQRAG